MCAEVTRIVFIRSNVDEVLFLSLWSAVYDSLLPPGVFIIITHQVTGSTPPKKSRWPLASFTGQG